MQIQPPECAVWHHSIQGNSARSEDGCIVRPKDGFFAVFDGHGGGEAVDFLVENMWGYLSTALRKLDSHGQSHNPVYYALKCLDRDLIHYTVTAQETIYSGSCGLFAYADKNVRALRIFNVGDCRAVLGRSRYSGCVVHHSAQQLTTDHNCTNPDEVERVIKSSGDPHAIQCAPCDPLAGSKNALPRVAGYLAVTRSFGDPYLKLPQVARLAHLSHHKYISCEPDVVTVPADQDDDFVILASDGLWEILSNEEAVNVISRKLRMRERKRRQDSAAIHSKRVDTNSILDGDVHNDSRELDSPYNPHYQNDSSNQLQIGSTNSEGSIFSPSRWFGLSYFFGQKPTAHSCPSSFDADPSRELSEGEDECCIDPEELAVMENEDLAEVLVDYALLRLGQKYQMSLKAFKKLPTSVRRSFHDDITVVVISMGRVFQK